MPTQKLIQTQFNGGISPNSKSGLANSTKFTRFLDIYHDSDSITLNPAAVKVSGINVTGLVKWMVDASPYELTNRWAYDDSGNLYRVNSSDSFATETWSLNHAFSDDFNTHGNGLISFGDFLYVIGDSNFARVGPLSIGGASPTISSPFLGTFASDVTDQSNTTASGQTYTIPTAISETSTNKLTFTPTKDPISYVTVNVNAKGTGNWTLTLHDSLNTTIGTPQVMTNSAIPASGLYSMFISSPYWRVNNGSSYHLHLTSTVADGSVVTSSSGDFSTAYFQTTCSPLVVDTLFHPAIEHTNGTRGIIVIGNERYLATYDLITYTPNKIVFPPGYRCRALVKDSEFVVALCWRGGNIDDYESGKAFYWDGISNYFNVERPITGGQPNAGVNFKNRVFTVLGAKGDLNVGTEPFRKLQAMPQLGRGNKIEVYPGAVDVWKSRMQVGVGVNCDDSTGLEQGVYEFGSQSDRKNDYQQVSSEVLNYGYAISTGTTKSTTMAIGLVKAFGKNMYIGWKDGSSYGVDKVNRNNNPSSTGSWESFIIDTGILNAQLGAMPQKTKDGVKVVVTFATLPTGCTVTAKYRFNRATSWTYGSAITSTSSDPTRAQVLLNGLGSARYREIEYGFDATATTNYPTFTSIYFEFDPLPGERDDQ